MHHAAQFAAEGIEFCGVNCVATHMLEQGQFSRKGVLGLYEQYRNETRATEWRGTSLPNL